MLCPCVTNNLPVVNAFQEANGAEDVSEDILVFFDVDRPAVWTDLLHNSLVPAHLLEDAFHVPNPIRYNYSDDLDLGFPIDFIYY